MLLHCPGKRCNTTRTHLLKADTNEAICTECEEVNASISDVMKVAMKAAGDVLKVPQGRKAFMYKCQKCGVDRGAKIVDEQAVCEVCQHPLHLTAPMVQAIKINGGNETKGVVKRKKA